MADYKDMLYLRSLLFIVVAAVATSSFVSVKAQAGETGRSGGGSRATSPARLTSTAAVNPENENLIARCVRDRSIPEGKSVYVSGSTSDLCERAKVWAAHDTMASSKRAYTITKKNGQIVVDLKLFIRYMGSEKTRAAALKRLEADRLCTQELYKKFGITLNLDFKVNSGFMDWWHSDSAVNLYNQLHNADDKNFVMFYHSGQIISFKRSCGEIAHEIGHHLGLPDQYVDADCPDRAIGPGNDLMNEGQLDPDDAHLYPNDIREIIAPLCGK